MSKSIVDHALDIATECHAGVFRWDRKTPYITHPIAVADIACARYRLEHESEILPELFEDQFKIIRIIALFHDICEDVKKYEKREKELVAHLKSFDTVNELCFMDYENIVDSLQRLNKNYFENYLDFTLAAKESFYSRFVKIGDITHNLSNTNKKGSMADKYRLAKYILELP